MSSPRAEFEELLESLTWDEPTPDRRRRLEELTAENQDLARSYDEITQVEHLLAHTVFSDAGGDVLPFTRRAPRRFFTPFTLSAAALVTLSLGALWLYFVGFSGTPGPELEARVIALAGQARVGGVELKTGQSIGEGSGVNVGENSRLELSLASGPSRMRILLGANTVYRFESSQATGPDGADILKVIANLRRGRALFDLDLKQKEIFVLHTPLTHTRVTGTKFSYEIADKNSRLVVFKGRVKQGLRIPELEGFSSELVKKSPALREVLTLIENSAREVSAGQALKQGPADLKKLLERAPVLRRALELPAVKNRRERPANPELDKPASVALQNYFQNPENMRALKKSLVAKPGPGLEHIGSDELERLEADYNVSGTKSLVPDKKPSSRKKNNSLDENSRPDPLFSKSKKSKDRAESRTEPGPRPLFEDSNTPPSNLSGVKKVEWYYKNKKKINMREIEALTGKKRETVELLSTGEKLQGVLKQEGRNLILLTPKGKRILKKSDIKITF